MPIKKDIEITLIISSLRCGGAERTVSIMANYWAENGVRVRVVTFTDTQEKPFFTIDPRIIRVSLIRTINYPRLFYLLWVKFRRYFSFFVTTWNDLQYIKIIGSVVRESKPDIIISFMDITNILTLLALRKFNIPILISERTNLKMHKIGRFWEYLRRITYPGAARIIVQTQYVLSYFPPRMRSKISVIPNPVLSPKIPEAIVQKANSQPSAISIGRLVPEKGMDLLIQAFAKLKDRHADWTLTIVGDGPERSSLESLTRELGLTSRVYFVGLANNIYGYLRQADLFILSSRYEGFPNALCEAMACGLAVISTDCPSGPGEIIRHNIDGVLVPNNDVEALAKAMDCLMSDKAKRKRLGKNATAITERFSVEKIMGMWQDTINEAIACGTTSKGN